jgi:hypothetical protein
MRMRVWAVLLASFVLLILLGRPLWGITSLAADDTNRTTQILIAFTQDEWWLIRWADNRPVCRIFTDHAGVPTPNEVQTYCGDTIYRDWLNTTPCNQLDTQNPQLNECKGLYLHFISSEPAKRTLAVSLPEPKVWVTLSGCDAVPLENRCRQLPTLQLIAEEPLPNEFVTAIMGTVDGEPFSCPDEICEIPLKTTTSQGISIVFWADSSYGDSSPQYNALVRVIDTGVTQGPTEAGYYVDVLSTQWLGDGVIASCAQTWQSFPPIGGVPGWLANPDNPDEIISTEPYAYLAGQLIITGAVDASVCPSGGLMANGWANTCGVETALPQVKDWQNSFNEQIVAAAMQARIPAQLLKNLIAQESQFWPGSVAEEEIPEYGFGRLTELGADTVLLWNPDFYSQFCPLVLEKSVCEGGYAQLDEKEQAMLRGALAVSADADCPTCDSGIDLTYTGFSISIFAQSIKANCSQVGQIIQNATNVIPGGIAGYEDLWRFTLVNYHAGPGCLSNAINRTYSANQALTWDNVSANLELGCETAKLFVENITTMQQDIATPEPVITLEANPLPTSTPLPGGATPQPTPQPTTTDPYPDPYPNPFPTYNPYPYPYPTP